MTSFIMQQKQCNNKFQSVDGHQVPGIREHLGHVIIWFVRAKLALASEKKRLHTSTSVFCPEKNHDSAFQAEALLKKEEQKAGAVSVL